ncbi:hypothetical protein LCGC14_1600940, partial [marine sediment metagenome]
MAIPRSEVDSAAGLGESIIDSPKGADHGEPSGNTHAEDVLRAVGDVEGDASHPSESCGQGSENVSDRHIVSFQNLNPSLKPARPFPLRGPS